MKQIEVQIMGQSYLLGCPEDGEERLRVAVEKVDTAMCAIRDNGKIRARDRIAVLAALNLAFDLTDRMANDAATQALPHPSGAPAPSAQALPSAAVAAPAATSPTPPRTAPAHALGSDANPEPQLELLLTKLDQALGDPGPQP